MKHLTIALLTLLVLGGCASTPLERMEANAKLSDFEICWRLAINPNYSYGELKLELETEARKRVLDCGVHAERIIAERERQLKMAAVLMAVGDALKTPQYGNNSSYNNSSFQNYAPVKKTGFLTGETSQGMGKICYYNVVGTTMTKNVGAAQICPISAQF